MIAKIYGENKVRNIMMIIAHWSKENQKQLSLNNENINQDTQSLRKSPLGITEQYGRFGKTRTAVPGKQYLRISPRLNAHSFTAFCYFSKLHNYANKRKTYACKGYFLCLFWYQRFLPAY